MSAVIKTPPYFLRPMRRIDLDTVMSIEKIIYPFPWTQQIFTDCIRVGYTCRVLEMNGEIAGYSIMALGASEAHILNISIAADYQRQGLGSRLLSHMLELAVEKKTDTVFLEVRPSNKAALALYEKSGFVQIGVRRNYYPAHSGREDALILALHLNPNQMLKDS